MAVCIAAPSISSLGQQCTGAVRIVFQHVIRLALHVDYQTLRRVVAIQWRDKCPRSRATEAEPIRHRLLVDGHVDGVSRQHVIKRRLPGIETWEPYTK